MQTNLAPRLGPRLGARSALGRPRRLHGRALQLLQLLQRHRLEGQHLGLAQHHAGRVLHRQLPSAPARYRGLWGGRSSGRWAGCCPSTGAGSSSCFTRSAIACGGSGRPAGIPLKSSPSRLARRRAERKVLIRSA